MEPQIITRTTKKDDIKNGVEKTAKTTKVISFKRIEIARTPVDIAGRKGAAPLLMNKMSDGVIELLGGRATGEVVARPEKMSAKDTADAHIHRINDKIVFPAGAFRGAIVDACRHQKIDKKLTMARVDGAFSVTGDEGDYVVIESEPYTVRADVVNTRKGSQGAPSVSFRPSYANWRTKRKYSAVRGRHDAKAQARKESIHQAANGSYRPGAPLRDS